MMFVILTRHDLRDEFTMADEAFALSPISARAAEPSDADYAAISEAFMETSRGRWFLNEYAKRNRNADTSMVLDAVARIEQNFAEQGQTLTEGGLTEALASIRRAVDEARTTALQAIDGRAFKESVGPIRKGARVLREIAWRLREIGADGRICDLIASQIDGIEAACAEIASIDSSDVLDGAFNLIEERIKRFEGSETAPLQKVDKGGSPGSEVAPGEAVVAAVASAVPNTAEFSAEASTSPTEQFAAPEPAVVGAPVVVAEAVIVPEPPEAAITDADIIHDDAVLDIVAMEMGAPDPEISEMIVPMPADAESEIVARATAPATIRPPLPETPPQPAPLPEPSLGESLLASGIVRRPIPSIADPFASIRRLSQVEKIAFFS